ncbi:hypothetical protein MJG53_005293 [Ovis ammon polii x Ovis aries]|uniref:Uncharacterized protein n=2 Tax=Ovis TaxID=9935 RepID=A0AAD4UJS6_OVIAM|nr:hypothetical protein MG293_003896 [Ovis ammon polii]KAI4577486.1 hypothetical protein MJT46_003321 [Ovis ammon polii x Ovis aries]KAI4587506.1 hypothetical protein MJG53_005293 [Ovis ammon polii x Ovis aries]
MRGKHSLSFSSVPKATLGAVPGIQTSWTRRLSKFTGRSHHRSVFLALASEPTSELYQPRLTVDWEETESQGMAGSLDSVQPEPSLCRERKPKPPQGQSLAQGRDFLTIAHLNIEQPLRIVLANVLFLFDVTRKKEDSKGDETNSSYGCLLAGYMPATPPPPQYHSCPTAATANSYDIRSERTSQEPADLVLGQASH